MSRDGFERALAAMIADPALVEEIRDGSLAGLDGYDLDATDTGRLTAMADDDRMAVNCSLYRSNRLTALVRTVPELIDALGDRLRPTLAAYWRSTPRRDLQFVSEARDFALFVCQLFADDPALVAASEESMHEMERRYLIN